MNEKKNKGKKVKVNGVERLAENLEYLPQEEKATLLSFFNELTIKWIEKQKSNKK